MVMLTETDGLSIFLRASADGDVGALTMMMEVGGRELLMLTSNTGASCAHIASQKGHSKALKMLIEAGARSC